MKNICKENFSFFVNKPFTIFEIDNFLPEEDFLNLLHSYPSESNFKTEVDNIMTFSNKSEKDKNNFNKFLANNNYWNIFLKKLNQKILLIQHIILLLFLTSNQEDLAV